MLTKTTTRTLNNSIRTAAFSKIAASRAQHTLPQLPYAYDALEPSISKEIMTLHHTKHHQTYVNGLNAAEESLTKLQSQEASPETIKAVISLQPALKFNGGGHINHSLFWKNLAPAGSEQTKLPAGSKFAQAVERDFGSLENLKKAVNTKTAAVQGSGWGWLVCRLLSVSLWS
ncbi:Superoxide dismutase [Mn], mitochondrial [Naganishia onofrii]|uniref:Superoxide dismutase [Mn], mitochondrial n=1 Tax=Naganishia onofrii TaxID=1851511 RepID=A0ACC2XWD3_9TREE|nr:Superoxide dismutase [Mn], mitochondrial [Naganishia onofrii]